MCVTEILIPFNVKDMIDPLTAATLAKTAVEFLFPKVIDGALQAVGGDAYKVALKKLKGFFVYKFGDRSELDEAESNPGGLTDLVSKALENDDEMKKQLAALVAELQKISTVSSQASPQVMQGNESNAVIGQNNNVNQSRTSFGDINISNGNGQSNNNVNVGNRGDAFRG